MTPNEPENRISGTGDPRSERNPATDPTAVNPRSTPVPDETLLSTSDGENEERPAVTIPGYEIEGVLGRGGMGVVYQARHIVLKRTVALKLMLSGGHAGPNELARFRIEAEAVARLQHPNIVQIHEVGEADGYPFCALEFVSGGDLSGRLNGRPMPPHEAARLVVSVSRAMQLAHSRNVVHRDLKPANVLLTSDGTPKITDFGLARQLDQDSGQTQAGTVMGTPSYMAPEQASGSAHEAGPAADVYALGAILYDCLAGRPPFRGDSVVDTLDMVRTQEPLPPSRHHPDVPLDLETISLKCLRKEPEKRFASAAELADELERYLRGEPIQSRPVGRLERTQMWAHRNPVLAGAVSALLLVIVAAFVLVNWQLRVTRNALAETERERRERALAQVNNLRDAVPGAVPGILEELERNRADVLPRLQQLWMTGEKDQKRTRVGLALLPEQPAEFVEPMLNWMLQVEQPEEVLLIRDALMPWRDQLTDRLWQVAVETASPSTERFRALVALAAFDPANRQWTEVGLDTVELFFAENSFYHGTWSEALKPAAIGLIPAWMEVFRSDGPTKQTATMILTDYGAGDAELLVALALDSDPSQFAFVLPSLQRHREHVVQTLQQVLTQPAPSQPQVEAREDQARRQAMAAVTLLHMGAAESVWPLLKHGDALERRSQIIWRMSRHRVDPEIIVRQLERDSDISIRRALIIALGDYSADQLPTRLREPLQETLIQWYREDPDAGIHAAVDWLLRHSQEGPLKRRLDWECADQLQAIDESIQRRDPDEGARSWYVNGQGQTLALMGPVSFRMGSPEDEPLRFDNEGTHVRTINRRFAIATKLVTVEQYVRFSADRTDPQQRLYNTGFSPTPDCAVNGVTWFSAAQYCNWLSQQEGIPQSEWCYPSDEEIDYGMEPFPDHLRRTGYRLATEAEWEYACRAGSPRSRYYGSSLELLPRYALFKDNGKDRMWPVGQKRPNDLGLFDMHGNAWTWTQSGGYYYWDPGTPPRDTIDDVEDLRPVVDETGRVLRGGSFDDRPIYVRAAYRYILGASDQENAVGLRVARTVATAGVAP